MGGTLTGQTVVVTRAPGQSGELSRLLAAAGARVIEVPTLVMVPVEGAERTAADAAVRSCLRGEYDAVLFTSSNAVAFFHARLEAIGASPRELAAIPLFAIGPATARALTGRGYEPPRVADDAVAEGLLVTLQEAFGATLQGRRLLLPRAREGREALRVGLQVAGAAVDVVVLYDTRPVVDGPGLPAGVAIDWVTFASPTAVHAFIRRFGSVRARLACIGPVTASAARELGLEVHAVGTEHTAAGLVAALVRTLTARGG